MNRNFPSASAKKTDTRSRSSLVSVCLINSRRIRDTSERMGRSFRRKIPSRYEIRLFVLVIPINVDLIPQRFITIDPREAHRARVFLSLFRRGVAASQILRTIRLAIRLTAGPMIEARYVPTMFLKHRSLRDSNVKMALCCCVALMVTRLENCLLAARSRFCLLLCRGKSILADTSRARARVKERERNSIVRVE